MPESELWITRIFNDHLASAGNAFLGLVGKQAEQRPWADFVVMQIVVVVLLAVLAAVLRPRLSVDRPGGLQHVSEMIYDFVRGQADDMVGHESHRYLAYFGTIFIFILTCNLIGLIPAFESPTMNAPVTCGCALATFFYYHLMGIRANGFGYLRHFMGPMTWLAPMMLPIEVVSHLARPLSLTVRLYANMFAGEQVTMVFLKMTYFVVPVIFMGLHIFVGVVQAYIFMLLTMVYVGSAVAHEH
ncbi:MAG TPA: F0F1 ATP synthase subunit A [Bryobacteraceae bacterium]|nr:F0F1 ATP synthase subunit A [Bryobacteraceae bacterium]